MEQILASVVCVLWRNAGMPSRYIGWRNRPQIIWRSGFWRRSSPSYSYTRCYRQGAHFTSCSITSDTNYGFKEPGEHSSRLALQKDKIQLNERRVLAQPRTLSAPGQKLTRYLVCTTGCSHCLGLPSKLATRLGSKPAQFPKFAG